MARARTASVLLWPKVILLVVAAFLVRPTALGQTYTTLALGLVIAALGLYAIEALIKKWVPLTTNSLSVIVCGSVLWVYLLVHALLVQSEGLDFVIKATISNLTIIFAYALVLSDPMVNRAFFRVLVWLLAALSASALVTLTLQLVIPLEALYVGHLSIEGYNQQGSATFEGVGDVYFPFSVGYGLYPIGGSELLRFGGLFREPGILQVFLLWGIVYALNERMPKVLVVAMIVGVTTTFSTIGIALLPGILLAWAIYRIRTELVSKAAIAVAGVALMLLLTFYAPAVGLSAKSEVRETSITDRTEASNTGLLNAVENPIGVGLYDELETANSGITLVALAGQIGILGFLLAVATYVVPATVTGQNRGAYLIAVFPVLLTNLLSQPLLDAPLIYVLLLARFAPSARRLYERRVAAATSIPAAGKG